MSDPRPIPRLSLPPEGRILHGWCLYEDDRWDGPVPQEYDDEGWLVYPDCKSAFRALAREMPRRCELFEAGNLPGENLACGAGIAVRASGKSPGEPILDDNSGQFLLIGAIAVMATTWIGGVKALRHAPPQ